MKRELRKNKLKTRRTLLLNVLVVLFSTLFYSVALAQDDALQIGRDLFEKGQFEEALKNFDKSVDMQPTNANCHYWRAKCLASLGKEKESAAEFKVTLLFTSDNAIKDECRAQLSKSNVSIPTGSVHDPDPKTFKLSTRKLDWNLQVDNNLRNTLNVQNAQLASVINSQKSLYKTSIGASRSGKSLAAELASGPAHASFALSTEDVETFRNSDVYIILDHSGSMGARDCPNLAHMPQSRIDWATDEMEGFTRTLERALPHGFTFITFNTFPKIYAIGNAIQFDSILRGLTSEGGTTLSPALEQVYRLHSYHMNQPLLIAVVTDGQISVDDITSSVAEGTKRFPMPNGMFITFAQVGVNSGTEGDFPNLNGIVVNGKPYIPEGIGLDALANLQQTSGAAYDPCTVVPFDQLRAEGLGRTILSALKLVAPKQNATASTPTQRRTTPPLAAKKPRTGK